MTMTKKQEQMLAEQEEREIAEAAEAAEAKAAQFAEEQDKTNTEEHFMAVGEEAVVARTNSDDNKAAVAPVQETPITNASIWTDPEAFKVIQRAGNLFASSTIAPQAYRGKLADCVIAIDMANRMGVSPLVIMQNSQIVQGNFSWKGTACKAMIDACGKYTSTRYVEVGKRNEDSWGYYLEAIDKQGNTIKGVTVDVAMAKADGWYGRNPKWKSMTELMLKYRAAAFFMRTECAGLAMGFLTSDEIDDIPKNK